MSAYNPPQTTVGYLPKENLQVQVQLSGFVVPPTPRRAYWGANEEGGGIPIPIIAAEANTTVFVVGIPPELRDQVTQQAVVLCQRINLGGRAIDGACTDPAQSALFRVNRAPIISTASPLARGVVGTDYSLSFASTGGTGTKTYSIVSGSLPAGLRFNTSGVLQGAPTQRGNFSFTVRVTDSLGVSSTKAFALTIEPELSITTGATLPRATAKAPYSVTLAASGGVTPYTWSILGSLPAGLTLNPATGVISGTPESAGEYQFRAAVQATVGGSVTRTFRITIAPPLVIVTAPQLPASMVGKGFSQSLVASGGTPAYTWQLAPGSTLPSGLVLISEKAALDGTPTQSGTFSFTLRVLDSMQVTASRTFSITIAPALAITTAAQLPGGTQGSSYSLTLAATGGFTPRTWEVLPGTTLPPGLSLNATTGAITGTPTANGTHSFTIRVRDAQQNTASRTFSLHLATTLAISTAAQLPSGTANTAYTQTLAATGGTTPYQWQIAPGSSLPAGLALASSTGVLSGTTTTSGSFSFTVRVTDNRNATASRTFSLAIAPALGISTPAELSGGTVNVAYSTQLAATGGTTPYAWQLTTGASLPPGLSLSSSGAISGTPTQSGSFSFAIRVTDNRQAIATRTFSLSVASGLNITTPTQLPGSTAGATYSTQLNAAGGTTPYTWSVQPGTSLPAGLSLNGSSGTISGTPTQSGSFSFTVRVTDAQQATATRTFSLSVAGALSIGTPAQLPSTTLGVSYSVQLAANGGTTPYAWQLANNSNLPAGLSLGTSTGLISGTPTQSGNFNFTIQVQDAQNVSASREFSLTVADSLMISTPAQLSGGQAGSPYSVTLAASGGSTPYTWRTVGEGGLPSGLSLNASSGLLAGTPTENGNFTFTVEVRDAQEVTATRTFTLAVSDALSISTLAQLPATAPGVSYSAQLAATGGTTPYTWQLANSSTLPAGLSLEASTGLLSGTPTQSGSFNFTIQVRDAQNASASRAFSLTVSSALIISTPAQLPGGQAGSPYTVTLAASGGSTPYTWRIVGEGGLPTSFALNASSGVLAGTPSLSGEYTFTIEVSDAQEVTAARTFTLIVGDQLSITSASELVSGNIGEPYSTQLTAAGGSAPYVWDVAGGTLPAGLTLASSGVLSGTPSDAGSFSFTIRVRDAAEATATRAFSLTVSSSLSITTTSVLQSAAVNVPYSAQLSATGGVPPYTWTLAESSTLPTGLSLQSGSGSIEGTPTQAGNFQFTIRVTDAQNGEAARTFNLSVVDGLTFTTVSPLSPGTTGTAVEIAFQAAGGAGALTYSLAEGSSLPEGLSLSSAGVLTGAPSASFDGSFILRVTDSSEVPQNAERSFAWRVNTPVVWVTTSLPEATLNASYSQSLQAEGGFPAYVFVLQSGSLPAGLALQENGSVNGTPTEVGAFSFSVQVADQDNRMATQEFALVVAEDDTEEPSVSATVSPTVPQPSHNTQQPIAVALAESADEETSGDLTVQFASSTNPPVDDPAIQFVSGGRSASFAVPPGETDARFGEELTSPPLQVGTVAGEITLQLTLRRNGRDVTPNPPPTATIVLPAVAPAVNDLTVARTAGGLNLVVRGFATGRAMQSAVVEFTARPGANISGQLNFTVDLTSAFTTWYSQEASFPHGSRFQLTIPVNINGDTSDITGVTVRLRNQQGESSPVSATF